MDYNWGIDLGGTKIEGVILADGNHNKIVDRRRIPTESHKGYRDILQNILTLIDKMKEASGLEPNRIGIGTPGTIDPSLGVMKNCNSTALNGQPLQKDLQEALQIDVIMSNDANCFAVAETHFGIVKEYFQNPKVVFGVIMGTGVGGGLVVDGKIIGGIHGIGGEWGHNYMDDSGGACYCGKVGCVETVISGPGTERYYKKISGQDRKLKEIVERYRDGSDNSATETMERLLHFFGKGISSLINVIDPEAIVIGGGVGNIDELYTLGVEEIKKHTFNHTLETKILKPKLGDSAGVFGAALL